MPPNVPPKIFKKVDTSLVKMQIKFDIPEAIYWPTIKLAFSSFNHQQICSFYPIKTKILTDNFSFKAAQKTYYSVFKKQEIEDAQFSTHKKHS